MAARHLPSELHDGSNAAREPGSQAEAHLADGHLSESADPDCESSHDGTHSPVSSVISMTSEKSFDRHIGFTISSTSTRVYLERPDRISPSNDQLNVCTPDITSRQSMTEARGIFCTVCPKNAFKSCLTCMASFCEIHVQQHYTSRALQTHRLVGATEDLEKKLCPQHHRELELYCKTDQTAICGLCVAKGHNGHDIAELSEHQSLQMNMSEMKNETSVPPPGPIEFTSVNPGSVCLCWGPPEGLPGPHTFRVSWTSEGSSKHLDLQGLKFHVEELTPGEEYTFTVATLSDGRKSKCVSATKQTDIPTPECLDVVKDLTSLSVQWRNPEGVDQASYLLTLCSDGETLQTASTKKLQYLFSKLEIAREYSINVSTALKGKQSKPICKHIRTAIPVPENLTVDSVTPQSADLSWSLHQGMEQIPHSFLISYQSEGAEPQTISTESCSTTLTDLQPHTQYTVSVCCKLKDGERSQACATLIQTGTFVPNKLSIDKLLAESDISCTLRCESGQGLQGSSVDRIDAGSYIVRWRAYLSWSLHQGMDQIPHSFLISYHSEGAEPQTISTESCSTTLTDLQPDSQYTISVSTVLQNGKKSKPVSLTIHTSERRIVLLGKSGDGKSSTGNTIMGEKVFKVETCQSSVTSQCQTDCRIINGRKIILTDTPGFFDTETSEEMLKPEIAKCIFDSSPGIHAFIIVLKVGRYTEQEAQIVQKITELFSEDAFKYAMILFTRGKELKDKTIQQFVEESSRRQDTSKLKMTLQDLARACNGRCYVIDNEDWDECSNAVQLSKLFDTIEEMQKNGKFYTNELLMLVETAIQKEMHILRDRGGMLDEAIRKKAKEEVLMRISVNKFAAGSTVLLLAFLNLPLISVEEFQRLSTNQQSFSQVIQNTVDKVAAKARNPGDAAIAAFKIFCKLLLQTQNQQTR